MIEIVAIPKERVDEIWPVAEPVVAKVLPHNRGTYTTDDVLKDIKEGVSLLLMVLEGEKCLATLVCTFEEQLGKKALHMPIVCGERIDEWTDLCHETIPRIAAEYGCEMVTGRGRHGWLRKLKKYGYQELYTVFAIEVTP
jgi:hypothetical protein